MKNSVITIDLGKLRPHPYHEKVYESYQTDSLEESFKRTGGKPINPIVGVPHPDPELYYHISGKNRLETLIKMGVTKVEVILYDVTDETEVKNLIVDLNKQRIKSGRELLMEFRHYMDMYPAQKGVRGNRYSKIAKEFGRSRDRVKDFVMLNNFFEGEGAGDDILAKIFSGEISMAAAFKIKRAIEKFPEKFESEESFRKICDPEFEYKRLDYGLSYLSLDDDQEFQLLQNYLRKDLTIQEFHQGLEQMGKVMKRVDSHDKNKVFVPVVDDTFITENSTIIKGNNREVVFIHPFKKKIKCAVGSPPYGNRRLNGDSTETDTGHGMTGQEYGQYLAETYERYKPHMEKDGSVYVVIDDYRMDNGAHACSLEHFVVEMEKKGFYLVGRYTWFKTNPMPRAHADKDMVVGSEMIYRFSLDPKYYYCNPDLYLELDEGTSKGFRAGCTNSDGKGNTTRGSSYYQSHLKKLRNTLDERTCIEVIKGNVANPDHYFRQADEKKHTSTFPMYLSSTLILESTQPDDLVVDIWNGVGNTMESALLLGRKYVGVELENDYFQQTCRRVKDTERFLNIEPGNDLKQAA